MYKKLSPCAQSSEKFTVKVSIKPGGTDEEFVSSDMSGGSEGSVVAEYEIDVYKKGAKANQLNGEKNPPAKAGVVIFGALLMGMVILAFILKILHQTWVRKRNSPEERFEAYFRKKSRKIKSVSLASQEQNNIASAMVLIFNTEYDSKL
ncbi:unnamed protein product [Porites evermanni]|uniref:Uncharacterized protein n=1 Tax=Porites evermanni TaxID=104178 RepID=A0ABN8MMB6_9CNID|nr:unnamed protein product [Porites evermanni]